MEKAGGRPVRAAPGHGVHSRPTAGTGGPVCAWGLLHARAGHCLPVGGTRGTCESGDERHEESFGIGKNGGGGVRATFGKAAFVAVVAFIGLLLMFVINQTAQIVTLADKVSPTLGPLCCGRSSSCTQRGSSSSLDIWLVCPGRCGRQPTATIRNSRAIFGV